MWARTALNRLKRRSPARAEIRKELGLDVTMSAMSVLSEARSAFNLEDLELGFAHEAKRIRQHIAGGGVLVAHGTRGGGYSVGKLTRRPLR